MSAPPLDLGSFVAAQGPALVRLARALLRDPHRAEDVVQDVLARAVLRWGSIERADDPVAYVKRMVVNASISSTRLAFRRTERAADPAALPETGVPDGAAAHAERDLLLRLLRRLPDKQRSALVLRHYEGLPDEEIAELLGCSRATVRSNAHRGLATLRTLLQQEEVGGGR
ncbi:SigE family RNA polymerase sigma factor [Kineococcus glutinatus]|uniref:SigE family RNA polymerase sigma factor n=1 Tax=Kineococcus glutinatus TaxID=1070872 RepID=UPI0031EA49C1